MKSYRNILPIDEPVGVYLSGGLDSSCITALAAKFHNHPVHTYSIHFGKNFPNELEFSGLVAQHCQTQHHILEITPNEMWSKLPQVMSYLDDPIGDPLTVPNYLLGKIAREKCRCNPEWRRRRSMFWRAKKSAHVVKSALRWS